jgi:hypothetical protein
MTSANIKAVTLGRRDMAFWNSRTGESNFGQVLTALVPALLILATAAVIIVSIL